MSANVTPKEFASPDNLGMVDLTTVNSPDRESPEMQRPRRSIGFYTACAIVIANIIGTGVFTSLGFQLPDIHSGFALLMLWIVGGIAALCGALVGPTALRLRGLYLAIVTIGLVFIGQHIWFNVPADNRFLNIQPDTRISWI